MHVTFWGSNRKLKLRVDLMRLRCDRTGRASPVLAVFRITESRQYSYNRSKKRETIDALQQWDPHSCRNNANFSGHVVSSLVWRNIVAIRISKSHLAITNIWLSPTSPFFGSKHFLCRLNLFLHQGTLVLWEALEMVTKTGTTAAEFPFIGSNQTGVQRLQLVLNWGSRGRFLTA